MFHSTGQTCAQNPCGAHDRCQAPASSREGCHLYRLFGPLTSSPDVSHLFLSGRPSCLYAVSTSYQQLTFAQVKPAIKPSWRPSTVAHVDPAQARAKANGAAEKGTARLVASGAEYGEAAKNARMVDQGLGRIQSTLCAYTERFSPHSS